MPIIEIKINSIDLDCHIPAISAMNRFMLNLTHDFPLKSFFKKESIIEITRLDPILVIQSQSGEKYECIAGARAVKLFMEYEIQTCSANLIEVTDVTQIIKVAIRQNILPLIYWPVALSKRASCFKFINELRKCLPPQYKKFIPSTSVLKKKLTLNNSEGRSTSVKLSALEDLIATIGSEQ